MKFKSIGILAVLLFLATISTALAADPTVTAIDSITFNEGMLGTFQVEAADADGDNITYQLENNAGVPDMEINSSTGLISWVPQAGQGDEQGITVRATDVDGNGNAIGSGTTEDFDVIVLPVLDVSRLRIGLSGQALVEYEEGNTTAAFKPGDVLTFEVTMTNKFTNQSHEIIQRDDVDPNIENVVLDTESQAATTDFPASAELNNFIELNGGLVSDRSLTASQSDVLTFDYQLPFDIVDGEYLTKFELSGDDQDVPSHSYESDLSFNLKIEQSSHEVHIFLAAFDDNEVSCQEKQNVQTLNVGLTNTGLDIEPVTIEVSIGNELVGTESFFLKQESAILPDDQIGITVDFDFSTVSGTQSYNIRAYRTLFPSIVYDTAIASVNVDDCGITLSNAQPVSNSITMSETDSQQFSIDVNTPENVLAQRWFVNDINQNVNGLVFDFPQPGANPGPGVHTVKVQVEAQDGTLVEHSWTVSITDRPTTTQFTIPDLSALDDQALATFENFFIENAHGKIQFTQAMNLNKAIDLDAEVIIQNGLVAINSANAQPLNAPATITLNTNVNTPLFKKSDAFTTDANAVNQDCAECTLVSNSNGVVVFTVPGFSTYKVVNQAPAGVQLPTRVEFPVGNRNTAVQANFSVTNDGSTDSLTNLRITSNAAAEYQVVFTPNALASLAPGASMNVQVTAQLPTNANGGLFDIGDITVASDQDTAIITQFFVNVRTGLEISQVEVDDKVSGKFKAGEENEVKVKVKNIFNLEIEDISIEVTLHDIDDNENLDQTSDEFDLKVNKDNEEDFTFDLPVDLDDDNYVLQVEVEGTDTNGALHKASFSRQVDVDRETHELIISDTTFPSTLSCNLQPTLYVEATNIGESDEDDVTYKVSSASLGVDQERVNIDIDKYSDSDNYRRIGFTLNLADAAVGTHNVLVEVFRDDQLEDSEQLEVTVNPCLTASTGSTTTSVSASDTIAQLDRLTGSAVAPTTVIESSFRETDGYMILLGMLVFLTLFAVLMGVVVMMIKRK